MPRDAVLHFDFKYLTFIDGSGLTAFCNVLGWLASHGVRVFFTNHTDVTNDAIVYLDNCGFFEQRLGAKLRSSAAPKGTTLPVKQVAHADGHGWLEFTFSPWMSNVLGVDGRALGSLKTCMKEVFNNILDHSMKDSGFVHVQHYPNRWQPDVRITVSDFGRGMPMLAGHMSLRRQLAFVAFATGGAACMAGYGLPSSPSSGATASPSSARLRARAPRRARPSS